MGIMANYINYRAYAVRYNASTHTFALYHEVHGLIADDLSIVVHTHDLNNVYERVELKDFGWVKGVREKHLESNCLAVFFHDGPQSLPSLTVRITLNADGITMSLDGNPDSAYVYVVEGRAEWGSDTLAMIQHKNGRGLSAAYGPAASPSCNLLFDRARDRALVFNGTSSPHLRYDYKKNAYTFAIFLSGSDSRSFQVHTEDNLYAQTYALHYKPMRRKSDFSAPPCGFMTWYAVMFDACEDTVLRNAEIQAEKLKPYVATAIWIDWEWYHTHHFPRETTCDTFHPEPQKYPHGMKYVADRIKELGLIPALWLSPTHEVRETAFIREHPQAVLVETPSWCGPYFFDPTHPDFLNNFLPAAFRQGLDWGFRAFKWDTLPKAIDYIDEYHDRLYDPRQTTEQALRHVVEVARETVGDEIYLLSCHGEADRDILMYADVFDAARIGADVFHWREFQAYCVDRMLRYYSLHNVVQYLDPDNLVLREEFNTRAQAVSRASFLGLIGVPITIGDDLTLLPEERVEILRRTLPALDIHPMEVKRPADPVQNREYTYVNLFIRTRWEEYQIVDVFNRTQRDVPVTLTPEELDLEPEEEYLIFDFWNARFWGHHRGPISLRLTPCESQVLAIRRAEPRPQLVSTSRHITQGACELQDLHWDPDTLTLSGVSRMIGGEDYSLYISIPKGFSPVEDPSGSNGIFTRLEAGLCCMTFHPSENVDAGWKLSFFHTPVSN